MDIKRNRREAFQELPDDYPRRDYAQGSAASDQNRFWFVRAQSWSEGADVNSYRDVENENDGEHARWGTPYMNVRDNPAFEGRNNGDDPLPNPHNFHSNPGYMGTSTASSAIQAQPGSGRYRTPGPTGAHAGAPAGRTSHEGHRPQAVGGRPRERVAGRSVVPAGPARESRSEGAPLVVSTGFPGG